MASYRHFTVTPFFFGGSSQCRAVVKCGQFMTYFGLYRPPDLTTALYFLPWLTNLGSHCLRDNYCPCHKLSVHTSEVKNKVNTYNQISSLMA